MHQAIWFLKKDDEPWLMVAFFQTDGSNIPALIADYNNTQIAVRNIKIAATPKVGSLIMRQEWNSPPRDLSDDMQPNVP